MVEELIKEYDNVLQLRLRMPIDDDLQNPRNFIHKIANCAKVVNIPNSMTVLNELVRCAIRARRSISWGVQFHQPGRDFSQRGVTVVQGVLRR